MLVLLNKPELMILNSRMRLDEGERGERDLERVLSIVRSENDDENQDNNIADLTSMLRSDVQYSA